MKYPLKWISFVIFFIFNNNYCFAQQKIQNSNIPIKDSIVTIFYDANANYLDIRDSSKAKYYRVINYRNGNMYGPVTTYYFKNHKPYITGYYTENNPNKGYENGQFTYYFENGKVFQTRNYRGGLLQGISEEFYPSGIKKISINYSKGKAFGCNYTWDENGKLTYKAFIPNEDANNTSISDSNKISLSSVRCLTDYYDNEYPKGKYKEIPIEGSKYTLYYKSNIAKITIAKWEYFRTYISDKNPTGELYLPCLYIDGFKTKDRIEHSYSYARCTFNEKGVKIEEKNRDDGSSSNENFQVTLEYYRPTFQSETLGKSLYVNFMIKDKLSDAIIQGFFKD